MSGDSTVIYVSADHKGYGWLYDLLTRLKKVAPARATGLGGQSDGARAALLRLVDATGPAAAYLEDVMGDDDLAWLTDFSLPEEPSPGNPVTFGIAGIAPEGVFERLLRIMARKNLSSGTAIIVRTRPSMPMRSTVTAIDRDSWSTHMLSDTILRGSLLNH